MAWRAEGVSHEDAAEWTAVGFTHDDAREVSYYIAEGWEPATAWQYHQWLYEPEVCIPNLPGHPNSWDMDGNQDYLRWLQHLLCEALAAKSKEEPK
jgi:hypothetical protein